MVGVRRQIWPLEPLKTLFQTSKNNKKPENLTLKREDYAATSFLRLSILQ